MRTIRAAAFAAILLVGSAIPVVAPAARAATCTPTGFFRDGINMTAALIDPVGTVAGEVDATGCNIGVYYANGSGRVRGANVHGANYFGILVNGDTTSVSVSISASTIHDIGEVPFNGTQHGVAIYVRAFLGGTASGSITGNHVWNYQKGGIVANGAGTSFTIAENTVTGLGPIDFIAQNGIQVGYGARALVRENDVTDNSYTGAWGASSGGILVVGGPGYGTCPDGNACPYTTGTRVEENRVDSNDVGIYLTNLAADFGPPPVPTGVRAAENEIYNDALNNRSGNGYPNGYQAGISDVGRGDVLAENEISGRGYDQAFCGTAATCLGIDADPTLTILRENEIQP